MLDNAETLPDPGNSVNSVIKCLLQWMKDSISVVASKRTRITDHKKKTMSNAIDGNIGHSDNEIDMTGMNSSNETKVDYIRPQVGRCRGERVVLKPTCNRQHHHFGPHEEQCKRWDFGYCDNEIDMADVVCLKGTRVNNIALGWSALSFLMVQV